MRTILLNQSNIVPGTNNSILSYTLPGGGAYFQDTQKVALTSCSMFYSTFNITAAYNNNSFQYIWIDGNTYTVQFPDGYYEIESINSFLEFTFIQNGHYLISSTTGKFVYFITLDINTALYSIETNCFVMNQDLFPPTSYTPAVSKVAWTIPVVGLTPCLVILTNAFSNIIGYKTGSYPATINNTINKISQSSTAPQLSPLSSFTMTCSLVNNSYSVPNNLFYCFSPSGSIGSYYNTAPNEFVWLSIPPGQRTEIVITFTDQDNRAVAIYDPNIVIMLAISDPNEVIGSK
jgi:hypothetical protein